MKKTTFTIVTLFLVLAVPVAAQFYRYIDKEGTLRFTDDLNKVPAGQRTSASEYHGAKTFSTPPPQKTVNEKETPQAAIIESTPEAVVSLEDRRAQIEKMKAHLDAEYQALTQQKTILAKNRELNRTIEDIAASNKLVDAFNQRAEKYEKMSGQLKAMADEYNALVLENNANLKSSK
jgi:hypothetical protein